MSEKIELGVDTKLADPKWPTMTVEHLILKTNDFIVGLDPDLDVDWETSDEYDRQGHKDPARYNDILNRAAYLECIPNEQHKRSIRLNFKRMVGEGVARALKHDYRAAEDILATAKIYITSRNVEMARFWQLYTGCSVGLLAGMAGLFMWSWRREWILSLGQVGFYVALACIAGALGAVLSMIFRMGKSFPSSEAPWLLHVMEAVSRVFAGSLSGFLIASAIASGLILPLIEEPRNLHLAMLIAATTAGASERWAPSLIARLEHRLDEDSGNKGDSK